MNKYVKNKGPQVKGQGRKFTSEEVEGIVTMSIKQFIAKYNLPLSVESIGYHMKTGKIDYYQPVRDRFVLLTDITMHFYKIIL